MTLMKHFFLYLLFFFTSVGLNAQEFSVNSENLSTDFYSGSENKNSKGFIVTHSHSHDIIAGATVLCNNNGLFHYENSYYLVYDLKNDFNLNSDWVVENVEIAVENAEAGDHISQPLIVKLWVMSDYNHYSFIRDNLTLLISDTVSVFDNESGTLKNIDFSPGYTVSEGKILVLELLLPDGEENNNLLFLGSNHDRYSDSTYIRAPYCDVDEPVNVSEVLFSDMMLIADIIGQYLSPNPEIQSFNIEGQLVSTKIKNEPDYTIKVVMPVDTVLNALVPDILIPAGFQITPASGDTVDFSQGPVTYTVDNNFTKVSQSWDVSVVNAGPDIIGASLSEQNGEVVIDGNPNYTVAIPVLEGSNLSDLSPIISVYDGFTVTPESGTSVDFSSGSVLYTVSHETLPLTQDWHVSVTETPAGIKNLTKDDLKVYPNPASNNIFIDCKNYQKTEIFNLNGKKIVETYRKTINSSFLPEGMYFLKIFFDKNVVNKKVIIKH